MPAHQQTLALHKGGCGDSAEKGLLRHNTHSPPDWELELCIVGTSFILDSSYCTNIDYHLKCAAQMDDSL